VTVACTLTSSWQPRPPTPRPLVSCGPSQTTVAGFRACCITWPHPPCGPTGRRTRGASGCCWTRAAPTGADSPDSPGRMASPTPAHGTPTPRPHSNPLPTPRGRPAASQRVPNRGGQCPSCFVCPTPPVPCLSRVSLLRACDRSRFHTVGGRRVSRPMRRGWARLRGAVLRRVRVRHLSAGCRVRSRSVRLAVASVSTLGVTPCSSRKSRPMRRFSVCSVFPGRLSAGHHVGGGVAPR